MMLSVPICAFCGSCSRTLAGCLVGILAPGALALDAWLALRRRALGGKAAGPGGVEYTCMIALVLAAYSWFFFDNVGVVATVLTVDVIPLLDAVEYRIVIGGSLWQHMMNFGRCCLALVSLALSMGIRLLHLGAVVTIRAPVSGGIALCLCVAGQQGLWFS